MRGKSWSIRLPAKGSGNVASKEGAPQGHGASRETTEEQHETSQQDFTRFGTDGLVLAAHSAVCLGQDPPMTRQRLLPLIARKVVAVVKADQVYAGWNKPPRFEC